MLWYNVLWGLFVYSGWGWIFVNGLFEFIWGFSLFIGCYYIGLSISPYFLAPKKYAKMLDTGQNNCFAKLGCTRHSANKFALCSRLHKLSSRPLLRNFPLKENILRSAAPCRWLFPFGGKGSTNLATPLRARQKICRSFPCPQRYATCCFDGVECSCKLLLLWSDGCIITSLRGVLILYIKIFHPQSL